MTKKKLLFILRKAPYGNSLAKEALDAVLATSAYEQDLSVVFMDDGVFQLLPEQRADAIEEKSMSRILSAFPLYGIDNLFVCSDSLNQRGIESETLQEDITLLTQQQVKQLLSEQDQLLSF